MNELHKLQIASVVEILPGCENKKKKVNCCPAEHWRIVMQIANDHDFVDDDDSIMPLSDNVILVHLTWVKYNNPRSSADDRPVYHSYITHAC